MGEERLRIFTAAELARRQRDRGLRLNAPEAVALIWGAMDDAARAGSTSEEVKTAGRAALVITEVLDGAASSSTLAGRHLAVDRVIDVPLSRRYFLG